MTEPGCSLCGRPFEEKNQISHPCGECLKDPPTFDWHRSCAVYEEPLKTFLHDFKFRTRFSIARLASEWIFQKQRERIQQMDFLIPVPLGLDRLRQRGFNQSLEIAKKLSKQTGQTILNSLHKKKGILPQTTLAREQRLSNLKKAFFWKGDPDCVKGQKILLIDDIYTTGATLDACARVLRSLGALEIGAITVAQGVWHR